MSSHCLQLVYSSQIPDITMCEVLAISRLWTSPFYSCTEHSQRPFVWSQRQPLSPHVEQTSSAPISTTHPGGATTLPVVGRCASAADFMRSAQLQRPLDWIQRQFAPQQEQVHRPCVLVDISPVSSDPTSTMHPQGPSASASGCFKLVPSILMITKMIEIPTLETAE
jgi:hypothetical protein